MLLSIQHPEQEPKLYWHQSTALAGAEKEAEPAARIWPCGTLLFLDVPSSQEKLTTGSHPS